MGGHRAGMHYRNGKTKRASTTAAVPNHHAARDAAYRIALGLAEADEIPRTLGLVRHSRPLAPEFGDE
ncbi:hypothetical protein [Streptomyces sp. GZWMJZ-114]|uniref:hypothetical protein n=1 Tax=Streptomyces sp. GZWMJZ-114 TaxID=2494734 RepID=UPI001013A29D|nr:hypothetical protein [Streptomyces sp. GZWMJZ-114]